jgi:cytochrome P450
MAYALALLATYSEWQEWLFEEINTIVSNKPTDQLEYLDIYHRLPRCLALMLETMRLFTPLVHLAKMPARDIEVTTSTQKYFLPEGTTIYIGGLAIHQDPKTWGADSHDFRPSRWLNNPSLTPSASNSEYTIAAQIKSFPKGAFLPWSLGPRACPGQKMSQVEFVSVFMTIFGRYRCEAIKVREGETKEEIRERLAKVMEESQPKLTLQMMRNQDLKVRWVKR